jgi:TDG/mug DNA glycosylase family protein
MKRPSKEEVNQAYGKHVLDVIGPGLKVLFCGINPGLYSAAIGHHFGRPGNRFWKVIHQAGFTPRLFTPYEDGFLLELGYGITNLVERATANAKELTDEELRQGAEKLEAKSRDYRVQTVAILGLGAYRLAFKRREAMIGLQLEKLAEAKLWVLPNPSGLNAHYQLADMVREYRKLLR